MGFFFLFLFFHISLWLLLRNHRQTFILERLKYSQRKTKRAQVSFTWESCIIYQDICHTLDVYHNVWARFVGISNVIHANQKCFHTLVQQLSNFLVLGFSLLKIIGDPLKAFIWWVVSIVLEINTEKNLKY